MPHSTPTPGPPQAHPPRRVFSVRYTRTVEAPEDFAHTGPELNELSYQLWKAVNSLGPSEAVYVAVQTEPFDA